jgi:hypothetical protein
MSRGPVSSLFASALLIVQLLVAPFAHGEFTPAGEADCHGVSQEQAPSATDSGADDCSQMSAGDHGHCLPHGHHCRTHAACSCPCAHTPALSAIRPVILRLTLQAAVVSELTAPASDPPLFELLRPPA